MLGLAGGGTGLGWGHENVCTAAVSFLSDQSIPVAEKTYLFKELYIETIIRNPKKVGLFGYRQRLATMMNTSDASAKPEP